MNTTFRKLFTTVTLLLVLTLSAFITIPVYADEVTPEETVEVSEQTSTEEEAQSESVEEEPTPPSDVETESTTETSDSAETVETILETLPEDTQLIVLDEEGEALPLATEEAAQAVIVGDPIWCPATVAVPTPGLNGCSGSYATFALLFADPIFSGSGPAKDGIIWVESSYSGEANPVDISSALSSTTLKDFKLTINGGWNGLGTGTLNPLAPSTFTTPLIITGWNNDITINNISIIGSNEGALYSLHVESNKNITLNNVLISTTTDGGAWLDTDTPSGTGNVTVNNSKFENIADTNGGLRIDSKGTVTLKNVTAYNNGTGGTGIGILIYNQVADTPKNVTITNVTVSNNQNEGLIVNSKGVITVTDLTAVNNGLSGNGNGATLNNLAGTAGVTLNGTNLFFSNDDIGLEVLSHGAIKLNNIHAVDNGSNGVSLQNNTATTPQSVTLTGSSAFKFNNSHGLNIISIGIVTLNNITANSNNGHGVNIDNDNGTVNVDVKFTGANLFTDNASNGINIFSNGAVTLNNINANSNTGHGAFIDNTSSTTFKGVTLNGLNTFKDNADNGLEILSDGIVTLNNVTANRNQGFAGLYIDNKNSTPATPKAVIIKGNNTISNNDGYGLYILSHGAITINNLTANYNGLVDLAGYNFIDNAFFTTKPAGVTFTGTSQFIGNYNNGLYILSIGVIKLNNITVNDSVASGSGAYISNAIGSATADLILTGTNTFTGNAGVNLQAFSYGAITISNLNASNGGSGASLSNTGSTKPKGVTLTGTNHFTYNIGSGLFISSQGVVTLNNVTANNNGTGGSGGGVEINNSAAPTPAGVTINGTNSFNNNAGTGLLVNSDGNIKANNITANGSINAGTYGASFTTSGINGIGSVTLTGKNTFIGNNNTNLTISSHGAVTLSNITASNSQNFEGVNILNDFAGEAAPKPVTLTGVNVFENNYRTGLNIVSYGAVTTTSITATGNGFGALGNGVYIGNSNSIIPASVTMNGSNNISGNKNANLFVNSYGAVKINNLTADNSNSDSGASILNDGGSFFSNVTFTGTNSFNGNGALSGLNIQSKGVISLSNITASNNTGAGVYIYHLGTAETVVNKPITISGYLIANDNTSYGVDIHTYNQVTLNNVTANDNGTTGARIDQEHASSFTPKNLTINGINNFNNNTVESGLYIETLGNVVVNNVTASGNGSIGMSISAMSANALGNITLKGNNIFNGNNIFGMVINANGVILANNVTANDTAVNQGVMIDNTYAGVPKAVTFTGVNTFNNNNGGAGLAITSLGAITLSNVTANDNGSHGAELDNNFVSASNVTLTGKNQFNGNGSTGLLVYSQGNITLSNVTAYGNSNGVSLDNSAGASTTKVTITGVNSFSENTNNGLYVITFGTVTLTKITADGNGGSGALINIASGGSISLTCGSFVDNTIGLNFNAPGAVVTLKGVVATGNTQDYSLTTGVFTETHGCPLP